VLQLIVAEEAANRALYQLEQARARIAAVEAEARVVEQYRDLVEEGRQQFHKEMASIMPDVKLGEKNSKLTEDELNMFITHAYRKVSFIREQLKAYLKLFSRDAPDIRPDTVF
jgi:mitofilin